MQPIHPLTSLALSVQANPGVYALLIGSGVSRTASIPTGWEVTLDLIEHLAAAEKENTGGAPAQWFKNKYKKDADYSDLLDELYDQGTRQAKLREYFEPNEQDQEAGKKLPTRAHRSIARLVRGGYIRVIITTNFDRLIEDAIRDEGIEPVVISSPDNLEGAPPIVHAKCIVVKVHGDYLDARIRNTKQELAAYDQRMDRYLDTIFDNFGLIISGWSSEYDPALRAAIERAPNRRYSVFWTARSMPKGIAANIIANRGAKYIEVQSADQLFEDLAERVQAAAQSTRPDPLDTAMLVAQVKRYLSEERYRIRLHDLIMDEATETFYKLKAVGADATILSASFKEGIEVCDGAIDKLLKVLVVCGLHADESKSPLFRRAVDVIAGSTFTSEGGRPKEGLVLLYPAVMAMYVTSLAAISGGRDIIAAEMLKSVGIYEDQHGPIPELIAHTRLDSLTQKPRTEGPLHAPVSEFLYRKVLPYVRPLFRDEAQFDLAFDRLEYLAAIHARTETEGGYFFYGRWMWHAAGSAIRGKVDVRTLVDGEIDRFGESWPYLQSGLFKGPLQRFRKVKAEFDNGTAVAIERMGW